MCRIKQRTKGLTALVLALLVTASGVTSAQAACGCNTTSCGIIFVNEGTGVNLSPGGDVAAGVKVRVTVQIAPQALCSGSLLLPCQFYHGKVLLTHPDGTVETLSADLPVTTGAAAPLTFVSTIVDTLSSSGFQLWTMTYGNPGNPAPDALDGSWITDAGDQLGASATCAQGLQVFSPKICITKLCDYPAGATCFEYGKPVNVRGIITNCGDEPVAGIVLTESSGCTLNPIDPALVLAPGASIPWTGVNCPTTANGCEHTDTASVTATSTRTATPVNATTDPVICAICTTPKIDVVKSCVAPAKAGEPILFSGTVQNIGDVGLTGVTVVDKVGAGADAPVQVYSDAAYTTPVAQPFTLGIGVKYYYKGEIPTTEADCDKDITDTVTAAGFNACKPDQKVTDTDTCTARPPCAPLICVTKQVLCVPPGVIPCGENALYVDSAAGVVASSGDKRAFCYKIVVSNCGKTALQDITLVDKLADGTVLTLPSYPTTLAVGASATLFVDRSYGPGTYVNTVTANGKSASGKAAPEVKDTATAKVAYLATECKTVLSSDNAQTGSTDTHLILPEGWTTVLGGFTATVKNTGQVEIDVTLSEVATGATLNNCVVSKAAEAAGPPAVYHLAVGESLTVTCDIENIVCPGPISVELNVAAVPHDKNYPCDTDAAGNPVKASAKCPATITCQTPVTCRTTGGGDLIEGFTDKTGCGYEFVTSLYPLTSATGLALDKVTHGGQLGAPYSQKDCGEVLGNPCIKGQWQHVRHYQGKGNPRDVVAAYHAGGPNKGAFDALNCACLPCCIDGKLQEGTVSPGKKWELCNKDDHKICGPAPRRAPANALIWSGIGTMQQASDNGTKPSEYVLVRVYIVDRSEPGGGHPGGSVSPADIYCYQAWRTGILTGKKPDFTKIAEAARKVLAADSCAFLEDVQSGKRPLDDVPPASIVYKDADGKTVTLDADVADCGPLLNGNRQIHPSTSATCP